MSFSLTTWQVLYSGNDKPLKDVTRRIGWSDLKPGERLCAIKKGQGLKKGEKVERLRVIEIVSVRNELLSRMRQPYYGQMECSREGFPELSPNEFIAMFCKANGCRPNRKINRIEFRYVT